MKKPVMTVLPLLCTLLLTACADAPSNVRDTVSILDGAQSAEQSEPDRAGSADYAALSEICARLQTDLADNHTQIAVSDAFVGGAVSMPTYACSLNAVDVTDGTENPALQRIASDLFGTQLTKSNTTLVRHDDPTDPDYPPVDHPSDWNGDGRIENANCTNMDILSYTKTPDDPSIGCYIHGSGYSFGAQLTMFDNPPAIHSSFPDEQTFDILTHPADDSDAFPMFDGTIWSVSDAAAYFEAFYNNTLSVLDPEPYTYKVKYLYVKALGDGKYGYLAEMMQQDAQGNAFDGDHTSGFRFSKETKQTVADGKPFFFPEISYCYAYLKETVGVYYKSDSIKRTAVLQENGELLTLSGALNRLSETLADRKAVKIPRAELCYALFCDGYPYFGEWGVDYKNTGDFWYSEVLCKRTCAFTLRPVWVFRTEYDVIDNVQDGRVLGEKYLVDAVTGEVTVVR